MRRTYDIGRNIRRTHSGMMRRGYSCKYARTCAGYDNQLIGIGSPSDQACASCSMNSFHHLPFDVGVANPSPPLYVVRCDTVQSKDEVQSP